MTTITIPADVGPSSEKLPPPPGYMRVYTCVDMIEDPFLRSVERLAYWILRRERCAPYGEGCDLTVSWPVDLPLLVQAAMERSGEWVIAMVGDLCTWEAAIERWDNDRRYATRSLMLLKKPELLAQACAELGRKLSGFSTKAEIVEAVLAHRYGRAPVLANRDLNELRDADRAARARAIEIRRELVLMGNGCSARVADVEVVRHDARYQLGPFDKAPFASIDEAVKYIRSAPPAPAAATPALAA